MPQPDASPVETLVRKAFAERVLAEALLRGLTAGRGRGLAQLRGDGFCSVRARRFPGTLVTKPFTWPGGRLSVNCSALGGSGAGGVRAEVLDGDLKSLDGLTREDADPIVGDGVRLVQTWRGAPEAIERLKARRIRLKFHMDNSDLYSFRAEP